MCVIRYLSVEFVWVIFCRLKYCVGQRFDQKENMVTFEHINLIVWFPIFKLPKKYSEKEKEIRQTPRFCTKQMFIKYVALGAFISAGIPKE